MSVVKLCLNCGLSCTHECIRKKRRGYRRCFAYEMRREVNQNSTCDKWRPIDEAVEKINKQVEKNIIK